MVNPILGFRFGEDYANAADCIIGECPYQVFLVSSTNSPIDIDTIHNTDGPLVERRILLADGYRAVLAVPPSDGYLYPMVIEEETSVLLATGGVLTTKHISLGPLVLPYIINGITGGTDPAIFSPPLGSNSNIAYWIKLTGPGILGGNGNGSYYDISEVKLDLMNNINYYLILKATASNPPGA